MSVVTICSDFWAQENSFSLFLLFPYWSISQSLLKFMAIESVILSNNLSLCCHLLTIRVFSNELALCISGQSIGVSASASVLPMNIQDWFPLELTGLISLQSKGFSRVFSSYTVWKDKFFSAQPSHICTWLLEKP